VVVGIAESDVLVAVVSVDEPAPSELPVQLDDADMGLHRSSRNSSDILYPATGRNGEAIGTTAQEASRDSKEAVQSSTFDDDDANLASIASARAAECTHGLAQE
jgi:hypothetical protein